MSILEVLDYPTTPSFSNQLSACLSHSDQLENAHQTPHSCNAPFILFLYMLLVVP